MTKNPAFSVTVLFVMPVFFSSCATLLNGPTQTIRIVTDEKVRHVSVENAFFVDSIAHEPRGSSIYAVRRSREPVIIHAQLDSVENTIRLRPHSSLAFWLNIETYGLGFLVDRNNPKRYAYRRWNYLAFEDSAIATRRFAAVPRRAMYVSLSAFPFASLNLMSVRSPRGQSNTAGPVGISLDASYFYDPDRYISLSAGAGTSAFADHIGRGYYEVGEVFYASIRNGHVYDGLDLSYGLCLADLVWSKVTLGDTVNRDLAVANTGIGFSIAAQRRIGRNFKFGVYYQPILFSFQLSPSFGYQHYLSAAFSWNFRIRK